MFDPSAYFPISSPLLAQLLERAAAEKITLEVLLARWLEAEVAGSPPATAAPSAHQLQANLNGVLEDIARGQPLRLILRRLVEVVEMSQPAIKGSVLLLDPATGQLRFGAGPSLPEAYSRAIHGIKIGPAVGSCGTAAHEKRLVIVSDIQTDPLWNDYRDLAAQYNLRACWSQPIFNDDGAVLGTFALYYSEPRSLALDEIELIQTAAHIAGIAIAHKQAQLELRRNEARQRALLGAIPDLMFRNRRDGSFLDYHAGTTENLAMPPHLFLGRKAVEVLSPELAKRHMAFIEQVLATGKPAVYEYNMVINGQRMYFEARMVVSGPDEVLSIMRDITQQKKLQTQMIALAMEKERAELLNKFVQTASHELRTPLAIINTDLYLMTKTADDQKRQHYADRSKLQIKRLTNLLDMVLMMTKLDSDAPFAFQEVDVNDLIQQVTASVRPSFDALSPNLELEELDPQLPPLWADVYWLSEAVSQLLDNALRFTPTGGTISVRSYLEDDRAVIEVADNGPGIAAEYMPRIFERFWRQDQARSTPGFGLGLPIAQKIVLQHGGELQAASIVDQGCVFKIALPLMNCAEISS